MSFAKPKRVRSRKTILECRKDYCERCGGKATGEPHHIRPRSLGGSDIRENLIQLCRKCHRDVHDGKILYTELVPIVAHREGLPPEEVYAQIGWPVPSGNVCPELPEAALVAGRTLEEVIQICVTLKQAKEDNQWGLGAACFALTEGFGCSAGQVAAWLGCSAAQVRELVKTYRAFPDESTRVPTLSWRHHRLAAGTPEPEMWIAMAADNDWSTRQMDEQIKIHYGKLKEEDALRAKAEKALRLTREVMESKSDAASWLRTQLVDLLSLAENLAGSKGNACGAEASLPASTTRKRGVA